MTPAERKILRRALDMLVVGDGGEALPQRLRPVADEVHANARNWMNESTVRGFGIGKRTVAGETQDELCIKVYVSSKEAGRKLDNPAPRRIDVPDVGVVSIDVVQIGEPVLQGLGSLRRPVGIGAGIGLADPNFGTGSLFGYGLDPTAAGGLVGLSCAHVIAANGPGAVGDPVLQPSAEYGGRQSANLVGYVHRVAPVQWSRDGYPNLVDTASYVPVPGGDVPIDPTLGPLGALGDPLAHLQDRMSVAIFGAASGFRSGVILDVDARMGFNYAGRRAGFRGLVMCTAMSTRGDSGALVVSVRSRRPVGMLMGGSRGGPGSVATSLFMRLSNVLVSLGVRDLARPTD
ncbi:MAG: hypothetical protein JJT88_05520 [Gammaproteobacteria bacterium]|nr:hypothetical protein [Gammaproteobacteria bacterium]